MIKVLFGEGGFCRVMKERGGYWGEIRFRNVNLVFILSCFWYFGDS